MTQLARPKKPRPIARQRARPCAVPSWVGLVWCLAWLSGCQGGGCGGLPFNDAADPRADEPIAAYPALGHEPLRSGASELVGVLSGKNRVFYVPERREYVIANPRVAYRYDEHGYLLEFFENFAPGDEGDLSDSGVMFGHTGYHDWVYTGDRTEKPYAELALGDGRPTEQALERLLASALDRDMFSTFDGTVHAWVGVARDGIWSRVPYEVIGHLWVPMDNAPASGEPPRQRRVRILEHDSRYQLDEGGGSGLLVLADFIKTGEARPSFLSENSFFQGTLGRGLFELRHDGDVLRFESAARRDRHTPTRTVQDIQVFTASQTGTPLFVSTPEGLYVARIRRTGGTPKAAPVAPYVTLRPLGFRVSGFPALAGEWQRVRFASGQDEPLGVPLDRDVPAAPRQVPTELYFHQRDAPDDTHRWHFALGPWEVRKQDHGAYYRLALDPEETLSALTRVEGQGPAFIEVSRTARNHVAYLEVFVVSGGTRIALTRPRFLTRSHDTRLGYGSSHAVATVFYEDTLERLKSLQGEALTTPQALDAFVAYAAELPFDFWTGFDKEVSLFAELINQETRAARWTHVFRLYDLFVDRVQPQVVGDPSPATQYLAIDMLAAATRGGRPELIPDMIEHLLGGAEGLAKADHPLLFFNLACYHALQADKPAMLKAVRRALSLGRDPSTFLSDEDFAAYRDDPDLRSLLR